MKRLKIEDIAKEIHAHSDDIPVEYYWSGYAKNTKEKANDNFTKMAEVILEGLGGKDNVKSVDNCITRLRLEVVDESKVDEKKIKSSGASGVVKPGKGSVQVVVGTKVQFVADEFKKLMK